MGPDTDQAPRPHWLVLRYMSDPARRETVNVGVILVAGDRRHARFLPAEDAAQVVADAGNYRAWVDWLHHTLDAGGDPAELLSARVGDNYLVERCGTLAFGEVGDPSEFCDELYARLVDSVRYRATRRLRAALEEGVPVPDEVARAALVALDRSAPTR